MPHPARLYRRAAALCGLLGLAAAAPASAFLVQSTQGSTGVVRLSWPSDTVPYVLDDRGSDDLPFEQCARILGESFATWQAVPGSRLRFRDDGVVSGRQPTGRDRVNLVVFDKTGAQLGAPPGSGIIALTRIRSEARTGRILDADLIFNGREFRFAAEPAPAHVLLRDVAVHEVGHLLGLEHTPLGGDPAVRPTMSPLYAGEGSGEASSLEPDDEAGAGALYPTPAFLQATGAIAGHVLTLDGDGVFGAHIIATDRATGAQYSTLSGAETGRADRGAYALRGLPAGRYRLRIEPVETAGERYLSGLFVGLEGDFDGEYFDNVEAPALATTVEVAAGAVTGGVDFTTGPVEPDELHGRVLDELANTPDVAGPYAVRFAVANAVCVDLAVEVDGRALPVALAPAAGDRLLALIPGQPAGSRVRYRLRAEGVDGRVLELPGPGAWHEFGVVALSGGPLAFVALREAGAVGVFDTGAAAEVARVRVGSEPIQVLCDPAGTLAYITCLGTDEIAVLETATFRLVDRIEVGDQPLDLALSADGRYLYATLSGAGRVAVVDAQTRQVVANLPVAVVGEGPYGVAVAGGRLWVTDLNGNAVLGLDGRRVVARTPVPGGPRSLAADPDGRRLYVTSFLRGQLTVLDARDGAVVAAYDLPVTGAFAVAVGARDGLIYVTGHADGAVVAVDPEGGRVAGVIPVGGDPRALAFAPDGDLLYVTTGADGRVRVVDPSRGEVVGTLDAGDGVRGLALVAAPAVADGGGPLPASGTLSAVYPNPFNPWPHLALSLAATADVTLEVYDVLGQRVRAVTVPGLLPGRHVLTWDGRDAAGHLAASGVYLFVARTPREMIAARRGTLVR